MLLKYFSIPVTVDFAIFSLKSTNLEHNVHSIIELLSFLIESSDLIIFIPLIKMLIMRFSACRSYIIYLNFNIIY